LAVLKIGDQLELGRILDRKIGRLNESGITTRLPPGSRASVAITSSISSLVLTGAVAIVLGARVVHQLQQLGRRHRQRLRPPVFSDEERIKVGRTNAIKLFKLDLEP